MKSTRSLLILLLLLTAACGAVERPERPETGETTSPSPSLPSALPVAIDWSARPIEPIGLTGGFSVQACPGEGPFLCVVRSAEPVASNEYLNFPAPEGDTTRLLRGLVEGDHRSLTEDRESACPAGFRVEAQEPVQAGVGGNDGLRSEARVVDGDGKTVERYIKFWALAEGRVHLLSAEAQEEGTCSPGDGGHFMDSVLTEFEPLLAAVAEGSRFPPGG